MMPQGLVILAVLIMVLVWVFKDLPVLIWRGTIKRLRKLRDIFRDID